MAETYGQNPEAARDGASGKVVLVAEDEPVSRRFLELSLARWGYSVVSVASGKEAWEHLAGPDAPPMAILDWVMPELDGPEVCRRVRAQRTSAYTYILLLTGRDSKGDVIAGLDAGADDYLVKPFDALELQARLRSGQRILALENALRVRATYDALTAIWNRAAVIDMLERELCKASRRDGSVGVIVADLDHFKHINDTHGHLTGDSVLVDIAGRTQKALRLYDGVGRYGGEEFLVVLPDTEIADAANIAERIRKLVKKSPVGTSCGDIPVTMSLGVASSRGQKDVSVPTLIHQADQALYRAKHLGRDRVEVWAD